jgi:hypothetical protein
LSSCCGWSRTDIQLGAVNSNNALINRMSSSRSRWEDMQETINLHVLMQVDRWEVEAIAVWINQVAWGTHGSKQGQAHFAVYCLEP